MSHGTGAGSARRRELKALPFGIGLGHRLRQVREERAETASDVAGNCHSVGLGWDRSTVTRVELGQRQVTAAELLLLTFVLDRPLTALLPTETTALSDGARSTTASSRALLRCLTHAPDVDTDKGAVWEVRGLMDEVRDLLPGVMQQVRDTLDKELPGLPNTMTGLRAAEHTTDEATAKAAKALGATALQVAAAAQVLWGRGVAAERDARTADLGQVRDMRARQARRGHVTRRLLVELRPAVEQVTSQRSEQEVSDGER